MESINKIVEELSIFGSPLNERFVPILWDISVSTKSDQERDWSLNLLLYCEHNENGPLGMKSPNDIKKLYKETSD